MLNSNNDGPLNWFFKRDEVAVDEAKKTTTDVTRRFSKEQIKGVASVLGFSVDDLDIKEVQSELERLISSGGMGKEKNDGNFVDFWDQNGFVKTPNRTVESERRSRYEQYSFMVANSVEVGMAMRTYIDEIMSSIKEEDEFFQIEVQDIQTGKTDSKSTKFINNLMRMCGVYEGIRKRVHQLCMYGDSAERIEKILENVKSDPRAVEGWKVETYTVNKPCQFERVNLPNKDVPFKFVEKKNEGHGGSCGGSGWSGKKEDVAPWDMIHFRLSTARDDLQPYGESLIEVVRSVYKRLLIIESLLALTRSSRVERIIMKVPTNTDNPDLMVTKLIRYKNLAKNLIFGTGTQMTTDRKPIGFTDILYLPKGKDKQSSWEMDRIQGNSVDLGTIEDVEYFQDKITNGLNLPRGWLKSDDAYMGYRKLALQDLRLARTINNVFRALAEGYALMSKILLYRTGKWADNFRVVVNYSPPAPVAQDQLNAMRDALDVITQVIEVTSETDPETGEKVRDPKKVRALLLKLANFPRRLVDIVMPPNETKIEMTTEEIKHRISLAWLSSLNEERVTSDSLKFVEPTRAGRRKARNVTEEMIV